MHEWIKWWPFHRQHFFKYMDGTLDVLVQILPRFVHQGQMGHSLVSVFCAVKPQGCCSRCWHLNQKCSQNKTKNWWGVSSWGFHTAQLPVLLSTCETIEVVLLWPLLFKQFIHTAQHNTTQNSSLNCYGWISKFWDFVDSPEKKLDSGNGPMQIRRWCFR